MGVMDTIRSIFGGLNDDLGTDTEAAPDEHADSDDAPAATASDANDNGLDDSVDEEMAINALNADIEAEKERATDKLLNYPGME